MKYRTSLILLIILSGTLIFVGYLLIFPGYFNLCGPNDQGYCYTPYSRSVGMPLLIGLIPVFFLSFFLSFLRKEVFLSWMKFSVPAFLISLFLILITSADSGGGVFSSAGPSIDRVLLTLILSILFLFISLIIIIAKAIRLKRSEKNITN